MRVFIVSKYQKSLEMLADAVRGAGCECDARLKDAGDIPLLREWRPVLIIHNADKAWKFAHEYITDATVLRPYMVRLTPLSSRRDKALCQECGFDEYVGQPAEWSTLLRWLDKGREIAEKQEPAS